MATAPQRMNWNARLALLIAPITFFGNSLSESPLAAFTLILTRSNFDVGLATGCGGVATLLVGPIAGYMADRLGRQAVLRVASVVTFLASGWMCTWLLYFQHRVGSTTLFAMLLSSQVISGVRRGIQQPALEAIFGDSVPSGRRSRIYALRSSLRKLGSAGGPAVAAAIFLTRGDKWTGAALTWVLAVGACVRVVPAALLWFFRDAYSLGAESEGLHVPGAPACDRPEIAPVASAAPDVPAAAAAPTVGAVHSSAVAPEATTVTCGPVATDANPAPAADSPTPPPPPRATWLGMGPQHVAPTIACADLLSKLGAGMSVRFFQLYFWQELGMRPAEVMAVLICAQLGGAVSTLLAQRLSVLIGRIQVVLLAKLSGVGLLCAISLCPLQRPFVIIPMYLCRFWLINAPMALSKSVLNDYVPKRHRAKWASLESINTSTWAGSAMIGGLVSDAIGYRRTFLITATIALVTVLMYAPLCALVAREEREPCAAGPAGAASATLAPGAKAGRRVSAARSDQLAAPLLLATESRSDRDTGGGARRSGHEA